MTSLIAPRVWNDALPLPDPYDTQCEVRLDHLKVMADIGAYAAEHGVLQPLVIHVALTLVPPRDDDLTQTFNYATIRDHALVLAAQRISLIETFARRLAQMCLQSDLVTEAQVRVNKPRAVPGAMAGTTIRLTRR